MSDDHSTLRPMDVPESPSIEEIRAQLMRILADPTFRANQRRREMLHFLVDESLLGRGKDLKGYNIALAVFGRDEGFDAQADPIVRIEARRLRSDLDGYYAGTGHNDQLRIAIPTGGYVPVAYWQDRAAASGPKPNQVEQVAEVEPIGKVPAAAPPEVKAKGSWQDRRLTGKILAAFAVLLVVAVPAGLWISQNAQVANPDAITSVPVVVLPFAALDSSADTAFLAEGMTQELVTDLMQFSGLRLYTANASFRQTPTADAVQLGKDLGVAYVVRGNVAQEGEGLRILADLEEAATGRVLWSRTYDRALTPGAMLDVRADVAREIATQLGQTYGVIKTDVLDSAANGQIGQMSSYLCVLQALKYRRTFDTDLYDPALSCLLAAVKQDPGYADAWAMLGWLRMDAVRFNLIPAASAGEMMRDASMAASRAVELGPNDLLPLQALGSVDYYAGWIDQSEEVMRRALAMNPNDPDTLVQFGWRLAAQGRWDEGVPLVEKAIGHTMNPPGWYYHTIAVRRYLDADYTSAIEAAERSAKNGSGVGLVIVAAAQAQLGNQSEATDALATLATADPDMMKDPLAMFRTHRLIESTVDALIDGLKKAGWKAP